MKLYDTTGWQASDFDAGSYSNNQINQREGSRTNGLGVQTGSGYVGGFFNAKEYSVVGLNVGQVENMRSAIRDYVNGIKEHLDGIEPLADANNAFRHEAVQNAMKSYINTVKTYCMNLTSQLLAFSDKLGDVKNTYEANMANLTETINSSTTAFDAGTQYSEKIQ